MEKVLAPIERLARETTHLSAERPAIRVDRWEHSLPRYLYSGSTGGGDPIRIGIFAGIHGDEPATSDAVAHVAQKLVSSPELGRGYQIYLYPVCNPTGLEDGTRHSRSGKDLNREFWRNSREPEVLLLEREIRMHHFHCLISLHSDDTSDGMYGFVRGHVLTRALLEPALKAAETHLPRNLHSVIDGFSACNGIISECYEGILTSPPDLDPNPFEIILETPQDAPHQRQVLAFDAAIQAILTEYTKFLAYAANL